MQVRDIARSAREHLRRRAPPAHPRQLVQRRPLAHRRRVQRGPRRGHEGRRHPAVPADARLRRQGARLLPPLPHASPTSSRRASGRHEAPRSRDRASLRSSSAAALAQAQRSAPRAARGRRHGLDAQGREPLARRRAPLRHELRPGERAATSPSTTPRRSRSRAPSICRGSSSSASSRRMGPRSSRRTSRATACSSST